MKVGISALLADMMTGAIPSTVPLGVFIVVFCQPLKDIEFYIVLF
jgi:hypothetical protein